MTITDKLGQLPIVHKAFIQRESMVISLRNFEDFELFCPLGALKLGVQQKKLLHLIQPIYIYFFKKRGYGYA